jgi:O-antigen/teichoic acid export membrane protein
MTSVERKVPTETAGGSTELAEDIRELLRRIFEGGEAAGLFTVLRNGEQLPEAMTGTDLDVSVRPGCSVGEVVEFLCRRGRALGWMPVGVSRRPHMTGFSLVKADGGASASAIHFDIFEGITYLGLPLLQPEALDTESIVRGEVRQLSERGRVLATTVHHLAWNGALLKEKYRAELATVLARTGDREWLLGTVDGALGTPVSRELGKPQGLAGLGSGATGLRRRVWLGLASRWFFPRPRLSLRSLATYLVGQLQSLRHPPGLIGSPGDPIPGLPGTPLTLQLACRISPHAAGATHVRTPSAMVRTLNGPRYERSTARLWRAWTPLRWLLPSLFLYLQAKRNRIVVLDRLPFAIRWLRTRADPPGWLTTPAVRDSGRAPGSGVLAGLCDTGLSSLATFVAGLFAARILDPGELGSYALVFSAFVVASMVPAQAVFVPAEVAALDVPRRERLASIRRSIRLGAPVALLAAVGMIAWILVAPRNASLSVLTAFTVTAAATTFVSPIQDHMRRMLHLADASWYAAGVSLIHLAVVVGAVGLWSAAGIPAEWVPFGALAAANLLSLSAGALMAMRNGGAASPVRYALTDLLRAGRWLLAIGLLPTGAGFAAAVVISHLAGVDTLGHAEAARIMTQPLFVLSTGLSAFLGPRSMEAGRGRVLHDARDISRGFVWLMLVTGIPYLLLTGVPWSWSPLPALVPTAYAIRGLVAATAFATILNGLVFPYRSELLGAGRQRTLASVEIAGNALRLAAAGLAGAVGAFAAPGGLACLGLVRAVGYGRALRQHYPGHVK